MWFTVPKTFRVVETGEVLTLSAESRLIGTVGQVLEWTKEEIESEAPHACRVGMLSTQDRDTLLELASRLSPGQTIHIERMG